MNPNPTTRPWLFFLITLAIVLAFGWFQKSAREKIEANTMKNAAQQSNTNPNLRPATRVTSEGLVHCEIPAMGSVFVIKIDSPLKLALNLIQKTIVDLKSLESIISSWKPGSEIYLLNARAGVSPVSVSTPTFELLSLAKDLHKQTQGKFDITIGPLWDLWPFKDPAAPLPLRADLDRALRLVDARKLQLDSEKRTAFLPVKGMKVNLGAIGKGYAAKKIIQSFQNSGIKNAAVSAGGDLFLLGQKYSGPWVVEIGHPRWKRSRLDKFLAGNIAVATSADSQRFILRHGKRYGHILDPANGFPAQKAQSVTILCKDPVRADAFATAAFVMGAQKALAWVETLEDTEGLFVDHQGKITRSSGWKDLAQKIQEPALPEVSEKHSRKKPNQENQKAPWGHLNPDLPGIIRDMIPMVTVPGGEFLSGPEKQKKSLPDFKIDITEVSNAQYKRFLKDLASESHEFCHPQEPQSKDHTPRYFKEFRPRLFLSSVAHKLAPFQLDTFRKDDHPVVGVDWWDAYAYARWAGKRLPTQIEWEKASRGPAGNLWPWGNVWNYKKSNTGGEKWGEKDGYIYSAPTTSFPAGASPYGCQNMGGNVAEWTQDGKTSGGSSKSNPSEVCGSSSISRNPDFRSFSLGFRCASSGGRS